MFPFRVGITQSMDENWCGSIASCSAYIRGREASGATTTIALTRGVVCDCAFPREAGIFWIVLIVPFVLVDARGSGDSHDDIATSRLGVTWKRDNKLGTMVVSTRLQDSSGLLEQVVLKVTQQKSKAFWWNETLAEVEQLVFKVRP